MSCWFYNGTDAIDKEFVGSVANITIDNTAPNVSAFYNTINNGNYSGTIILNVSVSDATMGVDSVYFNITNSSGQQNWSRASSGSGGYYNLTFVTSSLGDGKYNITVYANDTQLNNLNNSERIEITIDNTAPTAVFSCSPSSVTVGQTITCTCTPSDATSGVNSSATSYTVNPSTDTVGTFSSTCSFKDLVGNSGSATANYTVTSLGSSGVTTTAVSYTHLTLPTN